jgi:hypothetical protein
MGLEGPVGGPGGGFGAWEGCPSPCRHRAAAAPLSSRPTAENIVGEHRECVGASSLQSQRGVKGPTEAAPGSQS